MKKITFFALCLFAMASCNTPKETNNETSKANEAPQEQKSVGGDRDDHGCAPSAGQTWSEIKQSCIQVFNVGVRLNPVKVEKNKAVFSAFVVFNDDNSKLELFLPDDDKKTTILDRSENDIYQNNTYKYDGKTSTLYIDGIEAYKKESK